MYMIRHEYIAYQFEGMYFADLVKNICKILAKAVVSKKRCTVIGYRCYETKSVGLIGFRNSYVLRIGIGAH